jgi:hypothetical protein
MSPEDDFRSPETLRPQRDQPLAVLVDVNQRKAASSHSWFFLSPRFYPRWLWIWNLCRVSLSVPAASAAGYVYCVVALAVTFVVSANAQAPDGPRASPPEPMIDGNEVTMNSSDLSVAVLKYSGTVALLSPR